MRVVVQRVRRAAVNVRERAVAQIGPGLVIFVGRHQSISGPRTED